MRWILFTAFWAVLILLLMATVSSYREPLRPLSHREAPKHGD